MCLAFSQVRPAVLHLAGQDLAARAGAEAPGGAGWEGHSFRETGLGVRAPWGSAGCACFQLRHLLLFPGEIFIQFHLF